jgi:hypothetical protein
MATFPFLTSGAVAQYPVTQTNGQAVQIIRFLDGSDQRYLMQGRMLRQWQIRLSLLADQELEQVENFFAAQQGDYTSFSFPDPISGTTVPNCRFGASALLTEYVGIDRGSASFWVIETNG